jgi:hypothetical protein
MKKHTDRSEFASRLRSFLINAGIFTLILTAVFLTYSLVMRTTVRPPVDPTKDEAVLSEVIQIDVLNGCGVGGVATKFTDFLRSRGYDVVEMGNYRTFDVAESMVIDRAGNLENARKVAYALGIKESNVIQQINLDYFLDVTVVVGKDYENLRPMR